MLLEFEIFNIDDVVHPCNTVSADEGVDIFVIESKVNSGNDYDDSSDYYNDNDDDDDGNNENDNENQLQHPQPHTGPGRSGMNRRKNNRTLLQQRFCTRPDTNIYAMLRYHITDCIAEDLMNARNIAWEKLLDDAGRRSVTGTTEELPKCVVNCAKMRLSETSLEHLRDNGRLRVAKRVTKERNPMFSDGEGQEGLDEI